MRWCEDTNDRHNLEFLAFVWPTNTLDARSM